MPQAKQADIIYFIDFTVNEGEQGYGKRKENSMEGFRGAAVYDPLTEDVLQFAMRAARKKVIVKERPFSALFRKGLFTEIHGKRGQTTAYGVIKL